MSSSPSAIFGLEQQATGENDNTWGTKLNTSFQLLENLTGKRTALALTNVDVTLSSTQFADNQARAGWLVLTGTLTGNVNIVVPVGYTKTYLVQNDCTGAFTVTVKTPSGTGIVCPQAQTTGVANNGTNVVQPTFGAADASTLGGLTAAQFARLASFNQFTKGSGHSFVTAVDGATVTVDCTLSDRFIVTLAGARTLVLSSPADGQTIELWIKQDATGGRTLNLPANVLPEGGVAPTLSSVANGLDRFVMTYNQALDTWILSADTNVSTGTVVGFTFGANETDVRLFERLGSPAGVVTANIIVEAGKILAASVRRSFGLDLRGFASGSTINVENRGLITGKGGRGGKGSTITGDGEGQQSGLGEAGGAAIIGPGSGITVNITNVSGRIWGGGGGGGGGGSTSSNGLDRFGKGGGGGGGAGGGTFGIQDGRTNGNESGAANRAGDGEEGSVGLNGTFGAGGAGAQRGSATGGAGGAGGDFGAAGSAGVDPAASTHTAGAGTGGAAGNAIDLNGGTVNIVSGSGSPNVKGAVS